MNLKRMRDQEGNSRGLLGSAIGGQKTEPGISVIPYNAS